MSARDDFCAVCGRDYPLYGACRCAAPAAKAQPSYPTCKQQKQIHADFIASLPKEEQERLDKMRSLEANLVEMESRARMQFNEAIMRAIRGITVDSLGKNVAYRLNSLIIALAEERNKLESPAEQRTRENLERDE